MLRCSRSLSDTESPLTLKLSERRAPCGLSFVVAVKHHEITFMVATGIKGPENPTCSWTFTPAIFKTQPRLGLRQSRTSFHRTWLRTKEPNFTLSLRILHRSGSRQNGSANRPAKRPTPNTPEARNFRNLNPCFPKDKESRAESTKLYKQHVERQMPH